MKIVFRSKYGARRAVLPKPLPAGADLPDWLRAMKRRRSPIFTAGRSAPSSNARPSSTRWEGISRSAALRRVVDRGRFVGLGPAGTSVPTTRGRRSASMSPARRGSPLDEPGVRRSSSTASGRSSWSPAGRCWRCTRSTDSTCHSASSPVLVDADRFDHIGIFFPAFWTEPALGRLARGTPVAQCIPLRRDEQALSSPSFPATRPSALR